MLPHHVWQKKKSYNLSVSDNTSTTPPESVDVNEKDSRFHMRTLENFIVLIFSVELDFWSQCHISSKCYINSF